MDNVGEVVAVDVVEQLRRLYRGLEMFAALMRDPKRTGNWRGAERTADAFARYAATAQSLHALLAARASLIEGEIG